MAEREGFEPPEPCGSAVFKTAAIDHSATSPVAVGPDFLLSAACRVNLEWPQSLFLKDHFAPHRFKGMVLGMSASGPKHLLVDGANIGRAWPDVAALWPRNPEAARALLVRLLRPLHDTTGWRVSVVFDGQGRELTTVPVEAFPTFVVVFTPAQMTADDLIEQWVGASARPQNCVVATLDRALQQTVVASGAEWMSADDLRRQIDRAEEQGRRRLQGWRQRSQGAGG